MKVLGGIKRDSERERERVVGEIERDKKRGRVRESIIRDRER